MDDIATAVTNLASGLQRLNRMTHAGVVIATAAILDNKLERTLKRAMLPMSNKMYERLFDSFRPLHSFSSKIVMAYALGIITKEVYGELEKVRQLRNVFAHSPDRLHFESKEIAPLFAALKRPRSTTVKPAVIFLECAKAIDESLDGYLQRIGDRSSGQ
jgi:DNA-binding MltR family transcriptional regulator